MHNSYSIASFYKWEEALETGFPPFLGGEKVVRSTKRGMLSGRWTVLDYRKSVAPLGRAEGQGYMGQWMIAVILASEEPQPLQNP